MMVKSRIRLAVFTSQAPWAKYESFVLTEIAELQRLVEAILVIPARPDAALFHGGLAQRVGRYAIRVPVVSPAILICTIAALFRSPGLVMRVFVDVIKNSSRLSVLIKNLVVFPKAVYVARLVRRFGADHIHAQWAAVPATMALVVSRLTGVPWSFTAHRWDIAENNLLGTKIRAAEFARVISLHGRNEILGLVGESACANLHVIHVGTTMPDQDDARFATHNGEFHIASIGSLLEVKGHRYLIEACGLLRERGCRFVCHIIGGGPLRGRLETLVRDLGLREYVQLRGRLPHDEVIRMYRRREIDMVVHPSIETSSGEHEGIPVALMEAMAHRVPAISTESGGIPELLGNGAGVLVKSADAKALADAIQRVMQDSDFRASLIDSGFAKVSVDFNIRTTAERLVALMEAHGRIG